MPIGRSHFDSPAPAVDMTGWSEERKRFFMLNGYDRGPDPVQQGGILMGEGNILQRKRGPETTVRVTETPPDDPTPTKRVTTTKYPEGMEQPGMQGDPYAGLLGGQEEAVDPRQALRDQGAFDPLGQGPGTVMQPDPTWFQGDAVNLPPTITPEDRFGPQDTIAGAPELYMQEQTEAREALQDLVSGNDTVLFVDDNGNEVTIDDMLMMAMPMGRVVAGGRIGLALIKKLPRNLRIGRLKDLWRRLRGKGKPTKPSEFTRPERWATAEREAADAAAAAAGRGTAGTAGVEAAGGFAPKWTGIKTGLKVATPVAAAGLLDDGMESMPWWFKQGYESLEAALAAGAEFIGGLDVTEKIKELDLTKTEEERELAVAERQRQKRLQEQSFGQPAFERFEGLLSPAEAADTTAEQIAGDYEGLLVGQEDDSGIPITARTGFITKSEVEDTSREDADEQQAELDRYYANFPEDIEGKRERYLKALKEIYKKVAILNVIAALTNSPSQAGAFMQLAAEKFKTLEGFRGEERLQKIARGVFFDQNGVFDAPASKQDAFNRAMRFGANHDEALALSGHKREETARTTPTGYQIWSNEATGQQTYLPKGEVPPGEGWLPRAAPAETKGTAFERITLQASKLIGDGNVEQAVSLLSYWLMGKDSMLRDFLGAAEADTIARAMVERLSKQLDADPVAIAAELGIDTGGQGVTTAQPSNPRRPR